MPVPPSAGSAGQAAARHARFRVRLSSSPFGRVPPWPPRACPPSNRSWGCPEKNGDGTSVKGMAKKSGPKAALFSTGNKRCVSNCHDTPHTRRQRGAQARAACSVSRVRKASRRAASAKSTPDEAYRMARDEFTMIGPLSRRPAFTVAAASPPWPPTHPGGWTKGNTRKEVQTSHPTKATETFGRQ